MSELKANDEASYTVFRRTFLHMIMDLGAETAKETDARIERLYDGSDAEMIEGLVAVLRQEAYNLKELRAIEGLMPNGMSAMAMTASTGCNSVYSSTPPNNPHPYPWMNSLFQDGATIGWLVGESFIYDHSRRSVIPERFTDMLINGFENGFTEDDYFMYTHFSDMNMTDLEVVELPKVWAVGGDGAMGDIGFQNVSKVVMQNRPNVKIMLLDTQVYSNTGGQNSESSSMLGGFDMNQFGDATQGKQTERKSVAEAMMSGHGSAFVAQVSMANSATLFRAILDGLFYRGTAFFQSYTACMPEHGIADYASAVQALRIRDSRGMPEFVMNPMNGETYSDALDIKTNQHSANDWAVKMAPVTKKNFTYTAAHWAVSEARFRLHFKKANEAKVKGMVELSELLDKVTMNDIIHRNHTHEEHRSFIPDFGVYFIDYNTDGQPVYYIASRQLVIFTVERRKAWRMLQSRAGVQNADYQAQKVLLAKMDNEGMSYEEAKASLA